MDAIHIIYKSNPEIYLDELQFWLAILFSFHALLSEADQTDLFSWLVYLGRRKDLLLEPLSFHSRLLDLLEPGLAWINIAIP
jgi:hypothetical protein